MSTQLKMKPNAQAMKSSVHSKVSADTRVMTSTQSLNVVKTLIQTGIGVITYLRGVFPEECFNDDKIGPDRSESSQYEDANISEGQKKSGREGRGYIRVKHIKRGASKESDRVLDYLDEGAMDAIQRGFLRQLLFAMYLDPDKPRDVIECYTFNLTYTQSTEKSGELVPELEVRDQLREMSLGGKLSLLNENDPQQSRKTCGMVKRQVQALIKNLICSTQSLSDITGRRFLTFKLHYNDKTPTDYEPPHFTAGDVIRDRFTFGTSGVAEIPSATEMGKIDTGFHSVRVALATISGYLPEPNVGSKIVANGRSADEVRELELKKIREEAKERDIVWDTEKILAPSPPLTPSGFKKPESKTVVEPIGKRDPTGCIFPIKFPSEGPGEKDETAHPFEILKRKSTPRNNLSSENIPMSNLTQTEVQSQLTPISVHQDTSVADSLLRTTVEKNLQAVESISTQKKLEKMAEDPQETVSGAKKNKLQNSRVWPVVTGLGSQSEIKNSVEPWDVIDDSSIPTPELTDSFKKLIENSSADSYDPIESYSTCDGFLKPKDLPLPSCLQQSKLKQSKDVLPRDNQGPQNESNKKIKRSSEKWPSSSNKSDICECLDANDDQDMIGCEICQRWRHLNCYGYKSAKDSRIPDFFICFRCRIHKGMELEEMWRREDDIKIVLEGLRGLCIFRRTLNIIYQEGLPPVLKDLALRLEVDLQTASQIRNRLESEKFICVRSNYRATSSGIWESERKSSKKNKKSKPSIKSMVVNQSYEQKKLRDKLYFTPGTGTEAELLEKLQKGKNNKGHDDAEMLNAPNPANSSPLSSSVSDKNENQTIAYHDSEVQAKPTVAINSNNNSGECIGDALPTNYDDVIMEDGSGANQSIPDQVTPAKVKNKVSIGVEELEVLGVTWDDFDE